LVVLVINRNQLSYLKRVDIILTGRKLDRLSLGDISQKFDYHHSGVGDSDPHHIRFLKT
jgi:hypothetical protein